MVELLKPKQDINKCQITTKQQGLSVSYDRIFHTKYSNHQHSTMHLQALYLHHLCSSYFLINFSNDILSLYPSLYLLTTEFFYLINQATEFHFPRFLVVLGKRFNRSKWAQFEKGFYVFVCLYLCLLYPLLKNVPSIVSQAINYSKPAMIFLS